MANGHGCGSSHPARPPHEVAEIFRAFGPAYRESHATTVEQRAVMRAVEACRTSVLGGHLDVCDTCAYQSPAYNSCRNRHCPKCQALAQARWLAGRLERILPTRYFHVVFTLPAELRPLAMRNRQLVFEILFGAASAALGALARDPRRLGAQIGFTAVLHTWTRDLRFHPHLHCIVTGGGLSDDGQRWVPARPSCLFPVRVLSHLLRGKFDAALTSAYHDQRLDLPDALATPEGFSRLRRRLFARRWVVYAKRPFAGAQAVYSYLGRYTHRVAISNHRILGVTDDSVTVDTRNGATATMAPEEFIRRFLNHVLPPGFRKIRHYGLLASSNVNSKLEIARQLLEPTSQVNAPQPEVDTTPPVSWEDLYKRLTGLDIRVCPACKRGHLRAVPLTAATPAKDGGRAPP